MFTAFLIKYAEIGVKGRNRYLFEDALVDQIRFALSKIDGEFAVRKTQGRIYVDAQSAFDFDETVEAPSNPDAKRDIAAKRIESIESGAATIAIPASTQYYIRDDRELCQDSLSGRQ